MAAKKTQPKYRIVIEPRDHRRRPWSWRVQHWATWDSHDDFGWRQLYGGPWQTDRVAGTARTEWHAEVAARCALAPFLAAEQEQQRRQAVTSVIEIR